MKIEVGKFYKTRRGHKVRIYALDSNTIWEIHGAYEHPDNTWLACVWTKEGRFKDDLCITDLDIVSEWEERKPTLLAYRYKDTGCIFLISTDNPEINNLRNDKWDRVPHLDEPIL